MMRNWKKKRIGRREVPDFSPREIKTHDESYSGGQVISVFVELLWWPSNTYSGVKHHQNTIKFGKSEGQL